MEAMSTTANDKEEQNKGDVASTDATLTKLSLQLQSGEIDITTFKQVYDDIQGMDKEPQKKKRKMVTISSSRFPYYLYR